MNKTIAGGIAAAALIASAAWGKEAMDSAAPDDALTINQIQVVGTHNSYAMPADPRVMALMAPRLSALMEKMGLGMTAAQRAAMEDEHPGGLTDMAKTLDYVQMPLQAQLRSGVRSIELDLQPDPKGGAYADPLPYRQLREQGATNLAPIYAEELRKPGIKVFHVADLDFRSQCPSFRSCLTLLKQWSDSEPDHSPVFILLEPKLSGLDRAIPGAATVPPFDQAAFDEVDESIRTILGRDKVFAPDDLRGSMPTLEAAALAQRWPSVKAARGKFIFLFLVPGMNLPAFAPYLDGRPSLQGRMAFVQGKPGMAHTAFMLFDNALSHGAEIKDAVKKGYLVRARADIDTVDARNDDVRRRDAALASGAQIISTDYLSAPNVYANGYHLAPFAQGWRCNSVVAKCGAGK
ncbi:Ca2+-dependent phosphoinositide-specific phospholipase C [Sphingobium sp. AP49]|uniref:Ca2+-dependent phosphoinositide-specific phospholipase C n=1 Tax=Sphingobium sp. AP49 TaxID=1144307 RepID=UPI00026EE304|nr:Ca2+-dependent phosphoinositide-specific phospholipase C [Sphingobium sp. AP49]WHO37652.1 Ca2+-dependent phosphoinositide-specific phospholipase C [Sphingobium sp. AP49]